MFAGRIASRTLFAAAKRSTSFAAAASAGFSTTLNGTARQAVAAAHVTRPTAVAGALTSSNEMFCFHCEQTQNGKGCTTIGVCGKTPEVAALQDLVIHQLQHMSVYVHEARKAGATVAEVNPFSVHLISTLYSTLTNVNFSSDRFVEMLQETSNLIYEAERLYTRTLARKGQAALTFTLPQEFAGLYEGNDISSKFTKEQLVQLGKTLSVDARVARLGQAGNLQELLQYGLKGLAAYSKEALNLNSSDPAVFDFMHEAMSFLSMASPAIADSPDPRSVGDCLNMALKCGEVNVRVLELLDAGHCNTWKNPEPTQVRVTPVPGKCLLVSGHDTGDLVEILKLTEGTGINVYTHGELLPAHAYPEIKKYKHLVGNYGGAWQMQKLEFSKFPGSILMTTNCIVEPREQYKNRIFTTGPVGYDGVQHVQRKDFAKVVECAKQQAGFGEEVAKETPRYTMTGFGHDVLLNKFGPVIINAIKQGDLKHLYLIGGCDGSESERSYFKDVALGVPKDHAVLTLGCAKYRFNKQDFGSIPTVFNGETYNIPRLIDVGQCNDAYSAVKVAMTLAQVFGTNDLNKLPLNLVISWFEQKAVVIFLTLLKLGLKNVRVGPNLPAFVDPATLKVLVEQFGVLPIDAKDPKAEIERMLSGH